MRLPRGSAKFWRGTAILGVMRLLSRPGSRFPPNAWKPGCEKRLMLGTQLCRKSRRPTTGVPRLRYGHRLVLLGLPIPMATVGEPLIRARLFATAWEGQVRGRGYIGFVKLVSQDGQRSPAGDCPSGGSRGRMASRHNKPRARPGGSWRSPSLGTQAGPEQHSRCGPASSSAC